MGPLPKPELRGHLGRLTFKHFFGLVGFISMNCAIYYFTVVKRRKDAYAEYRRNYDLNAHMELLKKYGYLQSLRKIQSK